VYSQRYAQQWKIKTVIICSKGAQTGNTGDLINDTKHGNVRFSEKFQRLSRNMPTD
jgi:hypothetical protein